MKREAIETAIAVFEDLESKNREKVDCGAFTDQEERASIQGAAGAYRDAANYLEQEYLDRSDTALPFSEEEYDKLHMAVFPTLRRRDKYGDVGDVVPIEKGKKGKREYIGDAVIVSKETVECSRLNPNFLKFDTQTPERKTARYAKRSLSSFYKNPIEWGEEITLYWLKWVDEDDR